MEAVEIKDASLNVFSQFIDILEGRTTFSCLYEMRSIGLAEMFEMYNLINKYQVKLDGLNEPIEHTIKTFPISSNNLPGIIELIETHKKMTIFEPICKELKTRCAKFAHKNYTDSSFVLHQDTVSF